MPPIAEQREVHGGGGAWNVMKRPTNRKRPLETRRPFEGDPIDVERKQKKMKLEKHRTNSLFFEPRPIDGRPRATTWKPSKKKKLGNLDEGPVVRAIQFGIDSERRFAFYEINDR